MECVNCKCTLGVETGEVPFTAHDGETWCPQCFAYMRVHMDNHYFPPSYGAVRCGRCKLTTVSIGTGLCGQCRSRNVFTLPPKTVIVEP